MKAVVFNGPYDIQVVDRQTPSVQEPTDAIVKVKYAGLCGSDLHVYRGHEKCDPGFVMGHEFMGEVVSVGDKVTKFKPGDRIVSPFTTSCMNCFYCNKGATARCHQSQLFGSPSLDGAQAEYVRVPNADGTLFPALEGVDDKLMVFMGDILPTGYFAASSFLKDLSETERKESVNVVIGCGPVGLCTIVSALHFTDKVYALDSIPERLEEARRLGAIPLNINDDPKRTILEATEGRGADVVMEIVGHADAFQLAFDLVRPFGKIASVGVHTEDLVLSGAALYDKNVSLQFGRCSVRRYFDEALQVLNKRGHLLEPMSGNLMKLDQAKEAYDIFHNRKAQKIIFEM
uniref:ARAD1A09592p n=1 Tax=Blastobotrys adeninivorans TaxID=409370 RepID=A0A060T3G6_BLAAD